MEITWNWRILLLIVLAITQVCINDATNQYMSREKRIVNGIEYSSAENSPNLVMLYHTVMRRRCTGTLVNVQWVLTSASCLYANMPDNHMEVFNSKNWLAYLGSTSVNITSKCSKSKKKLGLFEEIVEKEIIIKRIRRRRRLIRPINKRSAPTKKISEYEWCKNKKQKISQIILHPDYQPETYANDVAMLKLEKKVLMNKSKGIYYAHVTPEYSGLNWPNKRTQCEISSFGCKNLEEKFPQYNKKYFKASFITIPILKSSKKCENVFGKSGVWGYDKKTEICAGNKRSGPCNGDRGAGLICISVVKKVPYTFVAGILSAIKPGSQNFLAIYTRVSAYEKWIHNIIKSK